MQSDRALQYYWKEGQWKYLQTHFYFSEGEMEPERLNDICM